MKHKNIKVGMTIQNKKTMAFYKVMQCDFDNDFYLDDFYTEDEFIKNAKEYIEND